MVHRPHPSHRVMHALRSRMGAVRYALGRWRFERRLAGPRLIRQFAQCHPRAFFIEIGANDGEQHDHLRPFIRSREWSGIMVEPVPYIFERLERNYGGLARVTLENAAIAERDGHLPFYYVVDASEEERGRLPDWYDGIGSFRRETVLAHARHIPDIERRIVRAEVPALTFESLCAKHAVDRLDLLVLDAEGYDWEILRRIDFTVRRPELLIYEHYHFTAAERGEAASHMQLQGYETMAEHFDTFCLSAHSHPALREAWRRLRPGAPPVSVYED
jgi:FkbM family methyltransferase